MTKRALQVRRLGQIDYESALNLQIELQKEVIEQRENDYLLLLEHPHTYTLGRRAKENGVLASAKMLETLGARVFETDRGGKVTYHGPGQIVGYPIISLSPDRKDVHKYVRDIEEVLIKTLGDYDIEGKRIEGLTGVHTDEGKIAAIGVHIKRWVTTHGFALNVNTDLSYFDWIIACEGEPVTSFEKYLGNEFRLAEIEENLIKSVSEVFGYTEVLIEDPVIAG